MSGRLTRAGVALALGLMGAAAFAARPLVTDDAAVLNRGACELEGAASRLSLEDAVRAGQLQAACGIGWQTQLQGSVAAASADAGRSSLVAANGKTFLRELTDEQAGVALSYSFAGSRPADSGWRYETTGLVGVLSVPLRKDVLMHANLGASYSRVDRQANAVWAGALEILRVDGSAFDITAEAFGTQREPPWVNLGVRYTIVPERVSANASWAMQGGSERAKLAALGFKLNF